MIPTTRSMPRPARRGWSAVVGAVLTAALAVTASPASAAEPPRFGVSVKGGDGMNYDQALSAADNKYGGLDTVRVFHDGRPSSWSGRLNAIGRPLVVSFKMSPQSVLSGQHDSYLRTWFAQAPKYRVTNWIYYHEPEDDMARGQFTGAQYRKAWQRISNLADTAKNPNLKATLTLMCWTFGKSGRNWRDYYAGPAAVDMLAFDCYNWKARRGGYAEPERTFGNAVRTMKAEGIPWGIAETGSVLVKGDSGAGRAAWLRDIGAWLTSQNAEFVTYFDIRLRTDYRLRDQASIKAWRSVVN